MCLNGLVVSPTFFNLSLNLAIRSSCPEPQFAPSLVFAVLPIFGCKEHDQSDFSVDYLVMSMCRQDVLVLLEEGVCYDQCILLAKL